MEIPYAYTARHLGDIARSYADASKANRLLNWKAEKIIGDMCLDAWNRQINNPNGYGEPADWEKDMSYDYIEDEIVASR